MRRGRPGRNNDIGETPRTVCTVIGCGGVCGRSGAFKFGELESIWAIESSNRGPAGTSASHTG